MASDLKRCGALWLKEGKGGNKFFSYSLEPEGRSGPTFKGLIFKNKHKEKSSDPDYIAYQTEEPKQNERRDSQVDDINDDDSPF